MRCAVPVSGSRARPHGDLGVPPGSSTVTGDSQAVEHRRDRGGARPGAAGWCLADAALPHAHAQAVASGPHASMFVRSGSAGGARAAAPGRRAERRRVVHLDHRVRVADRHEAVGDARVGRGEILLRADSEAWPRRTAMRPSARTIEASPTPAPVRTRQLAAAEALGRIGDGDAGAVARHLGDRAVAVVHDDRHLVIAERHPPARRRRRSRALGRRAGGLRSGVIGHGGRSTTRKWFPGPATSRPAWPQR